MMPFFDGTWNNRDVMPIDTNPATLEGFAENGGSKNVFARYYVGVGTSLGTEYFGGATGAGITNRVVQAYNDVVEAANTFYGEDASAKFVFGCSGFSRGATECRMFVNYVEDHGIPDTSTQSRYEYIDDSGATKVGFKKYLVNPSEARVGAMILFDTVSTGFGSLYNLSIPSQAENVLHLTARDEMRRMFPLVSAIDRNNSNDARILELTLPGAHSDIGGSYDRHGLGDANLNLAYNYMQRIGIPMTAMPQEFTPDSLKFHIHDSRGSFDRIMDSLNSNTARTIRYGAKH